MEQERVKGKLPMATLFKLVINSFNLVIGQFEASISFSWILIHQLLHLYTGKCKYLTVNSTSTSSLESTNLRVSYIIAVPPCPYLIYIYLLRKHLSTVSVDGIVYRKFPRLHLSNSSKVQSQISWR